MSFQTELEEAMQGVTDANTPPLAQWMIRTLAKEFSVPDAVYRLNLVVRSKCEYEPGVISPEPDALFSLVSAKSKRHADVWVDWEADTDEPLVSVTIITSAGDKMDDAVDVVGWSPSRLVEWLGEQVTS